MFSIKEKIGIIEIHALVCSSTLTTYLMQNFIWLLTGNSLFNFFEKETETKVSKPIQITKIEWVSMDFISFYN